MELRHHAAGTQFGAAPPRQGENLLVDLRHFMDQLRIRVLMGIAVVQAVNIRQEDQQLRPCCGGHHSGKGVIIAHGDLLRGNRVILVDDGQGSQLQQAVQGVVEVLLPAAAVGNVRRGDQKLGHRMIVFSKQLVIHIHQLALSHRRRRLFGWHIVGPLPEVQLAETHGDSAGGH